jgi:hypothetical protein
MPASIMRTIVMKKIIPIILFAALGFPLSAQFEGREHRREVRDTREIVERTQHDLREGAEFERRHGKEIVRYENAERHLSDFDHEFTRGHFDKDKLDTAIDDVKNVVEHNTLDPRSRDELREDLEDLRGIRAERPRP